MERSDIYILVGPINLSLWFIRELMIVCLLSPLVYFAVKYLRFPGVLIMGILWFLGKFPAPFFFFSLGALLSISGDVKDEGFRKIGPYLILIYACSVIPALKDDMVMSLSILVGLPMMVYIALSLCDFAKRGIDTKWRSMIFFVYLYHYVPLVSLKKLLVSVFHPSGELAIFAIYFASVAIVIISLVLIYMALRKLLPSFLRILAGGR